MPLQIGSTMIGVQAAAAPVVVSLVSIGRELKQDLFVVGEVRRANNKPGFHLGCPAVSSDKLAATIGDFKRGGAVAGLPFGRNQH